MLLLKTIDGRASESGVLPMMRAEEQKTAAASALAGGGAAVGSAARLCERDSRSDSMEKWRRKKKSNQIKSTQSDQDIPFLFILCFVSTVLSGEKMKTALPVSFKYLFLLDS